MEVKRNCNHATCDTVCRRPAKPPAPRKRIKKVSAKQARDNRTYSKERKRFLEDNPICQANFQTCTIVATQVHHRKGRIGENFLDTKTWLACCATCHNVIELNPDLSKRLGLSESRLT